MNAPAPMLPTIPADLLGLHALTMTAPWATAIMRWGKRWENRGWTPPISLMGQRDPWMIPGGYAWHPPSIAGGRVVPTGAPPLTTFTRA